MDTGLRTDAADVLAGVGRHWAWVLGFGIVTLLAGPVASGPEASCATSSTT
jgi:hypothetical protein